MSGTRRVAAIALILSLIGLGIVFAVPKASQIEVMNGIWDINTGTYAASIDGSKYYIDIAMQGRNTQTYPSCDMGTIVISPTGDGAWGNHNPSGLRVTIGAVIPVRADGSPSPDGNPVKAYEYDAGGKHWEQYYFQYTVMFATLTKDGNDASIDAEIYVGTNVNTDWTNKTISCAYGGAQIISVEDGAVDASQSQYVSDNQHAARTGMPGSSDVSPKIQPYQAAGSVIGPQQVTAKGTDENKWYIMQMGAFLTPGIGYTYFAVFPTGINFHINVYMKYTVRFSVLVSRPPIVENVIGKITTLDNYKDKQGWTNTDIFGFVGTAISGFLIAIVVILLIIFVIPKLIGSRQKIDIDIEDKKGSEVA